MMAIVLFFKSKSMLYNNSPFSTEIFWWISSIILISFFISLYFLEKNGKIK